jgi:hypothetical protein
VKLQRTIRTRPRNGLAISDVLTSALASELLSPGPELWLATGWVSDIEVIDNFGGQFDCLVPEQSRRGMTLSQVLGELSRRGTALHVAVRDDPHNFGFVERLERACNRGNLFVYTSPDLHEKILCGWTWLLKGSMNFTWNGTQKNEESIDFLSDPGAVARQRLELQTRWMDSRA